MDRKTLDAIVAEVEDFMDNASSAMWEKEAPQKASNYVDPAWLAKEQQVLRSHPVIVGHGSKIKSPGDYFTHDALGIPILVVRQEDGSVRAMLNICTHRGARLCSDLHGNRKAFVCPNHAWTFKTDGSVRGIPRQEAFPSIDKNQYGLQLLPCEERHGFIWVVATPGVSIDVAAHLGALDAELASYSGADYVLEREGFMPEDMNWKFVLDGFLEVYHFSSLHAKSIAPYFFGNHSPFHTFGRHGRMVGVRASFSKLRGQPKAHLETMELIKHFAVNYMIFPNTMLVWQGDHFECWTSFPAGQPNKCLTHIQSITTKEMAEQEFKDKWTRNWNIMIGTVVAEDWAVSKGIQNSLHAMPGDRIVFGRNEPGLQHFHGQLAQCIGVTAETTEQ
jgi:phenylpropionate dioxygenase-like ring-hydroxylating dioxygenase large terminal subunit